MNTITAIAVSIVCLFALFCASTPPRPDAGTLIKQQKYHELWTISINQLNDSPSDRASYQHLINNLDLLLTEINPLGPAYNEAGAINKKMETLDDEKLFIEKLSADYAKLMQAFQLRETMLRDKEWYATIKVELADKEKQIAALYRTYITIHELLANRLTARDNMARRLYAAGMLQRNAMNYRVARASLSCAANYNHEYAESTSLIISAMDRHEQVLEKLKSDPKNSEALGLLKQALWIDPTNENIVKTAEPFLRAFTNQAVSLERQWLPAGAALEYYQIYCFFPPAHKRKNEYRSRYENAIKAVRNIPLLSIAMTARDAGVYAKQANEFAAKAESNLRLEKKSGASFIDIKPSWHIKTVNTPSNLSPRFNGTDIGIGITINTIKVDINETGDDPKSRKFTYCQKCKEAVNPEWKKAQENLASAQSGVSAAQTAIDVARMMGNRNLSGLSAVLNNAQRVLNAAQRVVDAMPRTIWVDDIREATWSEVTKTKTATIESQIALFAPDGSAITSIAVNGTGSHSAVGIRPGDYADRVGISAREAVLKSDEELRNAAQADLIGKISSTIITAIKNEYARFLIKKIPSDPSNPRERDRAVDSLMRLLILLPDSSETGEVQNRLAAILPGYQRWEIKK